MRYRARVIPLYEGHRQEAKATWEYTNAVSIAHAGRFLRIRYPYPKYVVEEPILDLAIPKAEAVTPAPEVTKGRIGFNTRVLGEAPVIKLNQGAVTQSIRSDAEIKGLSVGDMIDISLDGKPISKARISSIDKVKLSDLTLDDAVRGGFNNLEDLHKALRRAGFRFKSLEAYIANKVRFEVSPKVVAPTAPAVEIPKAEAVTPTPEVTRKVMGTCYEDAWRFQMKQQEGTLVHGSITGANGVTMKHAWVELDTGYIYEPQTKQFFPKDVFESTFKPKIDAEYTVEEAAIRLVKEGYHGAWVKKTPQVTILKAEPGIFDKQETVYTITDPGKTVFHVGDVITEEALFDENERVIKLGEMPAIGKSKQGLILTHAERKDVVEMTREKNPGVRYSIICPASKEPYVYKGWLEKCPLKFVHPSACHLCIEEERYKDEWWKENAKS